jgi:hypothetical protein
MDECRVIDLEVENVCKIALFELLPFPAWIPADLE